MTDTFKHPDSDLVGLSDELTALFAAESAVLSAGISHQVMVQLPRKAGLAAIFARAICGVILIASVGCLCLGAQLIGAQGGLYSPVTVLRIFTGGGSVVMALLLSVAAPKIVLWDCRFRKWLTGTAILPRPTDIVFVRVAALALAVMGSLFLL